MNNGELALSIRQPGGCSQTIGSGIFATPGTWYHIVGTNNGTTAKVYVDGQLRNSGNVDPNYNGTSSGLRIGGEVCCGSNNFPGDIDEVRVWNYARVQNEIQNDMERILEGNESGLIGYWNFDDGTANDLSLIHI